MPKWLLVFLQILSIPLLFFGATFKIQHWPFGGIIFYTSMSTTLFCFVYQVWKMSKLNNKGKSKGVYGFILMLPLTLLVYINAPGHNVRYFYIAAIFIVLNIINLIFVTPKIFNKADE